MMTMTSRATIAIEAFVMFLSKSEYATISNRLRVDEPSLIFDKLHLVTEKYLFLPFPPHPIYTHAFKEDTRYARPS